MCQKHKTGKAEEGEEKETGGQICAPDSSLGIKVISALCIGLRGIAF